MDLTSSVKGVTSFLYTTFSQGHPAISITGSSIVVLHFKKHRLWSESLTIIMQFGLTMIGCILFCFWIGHLLDKWLGTGGIFITVFIILGVVGGGVTVYRQIMDFTISDDKKDPHGDREM